MAGGTDLVGALRAYAQKALGSDFNPEKAAAALNSWVKESGDVLKERIERETERAVKKLGLAKESELLKLREELAALRKELGLKSKANSGEKKSSKKKPEQQRVKKGGAKSATKRKASAPAKKTVKKSARGAK
ncbi:MAG: hypothetical protein RLZZ07_750 [Actinomycetota bacterium]|jgi:hypothetical protein